MKFLCRLLLFRLMGWKTDVTVPDRKKCILCVAPHTSNWDFIIGKLYYNAEGKFSQFLMKKDWFFWPLGILLRKMGGIPVFRSQKMSLTDQLAEIAKKEDTFKLAVTPEGTRSLNASWKRGFYFIALKAGIPIQLYALDYAQKKIVCTTEIVPSGDVEADMKKIMAYYATFEQSGRHPEKFTTETF